MSNFFTGTLQLHHRLSLVLDHRELVYMSPGAFQHWFKNSITHEQPVVSLPGVDQLFRKTEGFDIDNLLARLEASSECLRERITLQQKPELLEADLVARKGANNLVIIVIQSLDYTASFQPIDEHVLLQSIISHAPVGIWYVHKDGELGFFNQAFINVLEQPKEDFSERFHYVGNLPHPIARGCMASDMQAMKTLQSITVHEHVRLKNDQMKYMEITKVPLLDATGGLRGTIGIITDLTDYQITKRDLMREKDRAIITLSAIGDGVITTNKQGIIDYVNPAAERLMAWPFKEAVGMPVNHVLNRKDPRTGQPQLIDVEQYQKPGLPLHDHSRSILTNRHGAEFSIHESIASIHDHSSRPSGLVITFKDNTETLKLAKRLDHYSKHDNLTGLLNRQELCRIIGNEIKKPHSNTLFLVIDIDQFKIIINTAGNSAGNFLLKFISTMLSTIVTEHDYLGRLSSDVFGLILTGMNDEDARLIARKVAQTFKDNPFTWKDRQYNLSSSVGMVTINNETGSVDDAISQAHLACYAAKDSGRGHFHLYNSEDQPTFRLQDELILVQDIDYGLRNNTFELYCQPIIGLQKQQEQRIEILIRLRKHDGELIMPSHFIPVAENYGLMPNIDTWVLDNLVAKHHQDFLDRPELIININLSGRSLSNSKLLRNIHYFLSKNPAIAKRLCFEITETATISELDVALNFMKALQTLGCQLALDDFGSGLSSFKYLKTLPVNILKIDGSFIRNMDRDTIDHAMVNSIHDVCKAMNVEVVAEYVESKALEDLVKTMGIDYAQGFYYSRPMLLTEYFQNDGKHSTSIKNVQ
ncbi:EAL domain-containing protein [bacterium]|nr:EAL domain-containing protein [bacterium]